MSLAWNDIATYLGLGILAGFGLGLVLGMISFWVSGMVHIFDEI